VSGACTGPGFRAGAGEAYAASGLSVVGLLRAAAPARRVAAPSGRLAATVALQRRHHAKLAR